MKKIPFAVVVLFALFFNVHTVALCGKEFAMAGQYGFFDVRDFGAKGDGVANDTAAFRNAIQQAEKVEGTVFVPPGRYAIGELQLSARIEIRGQANFNYRRSAGSVLTLHPEEKGAKCLLNLTGAYGCHVTGLCLVGLGVGVKSNDRPICGILIDKPDYGREEDTPVIDSCRIEKFSGDGIRLERIWCFSVRHCHCIGNGGCGLRVRGWDGFILDNWFSGNRGAGFGAYEENSSITMTGNRIEWNMDGGIFVRGGAKYNITGNYIDRSGKCGICLENASDMAITGNIIYRSGKPEWTPDEAMSMHVKVTGSAGIAFTGNSLAIGSDDGGQGMRSPVTAIYIGESKRCTFVGNTLNRASLKHLIVQEGTLTDCVVKDNPGSIAK